MLQHASALLQTNNLLAAETILRETFIQYPAQPDVLLLLGQLRFRQELHIQAEELLRRSLELIQRQSPHHASALVYLSLALKGQGRVQESIDVLRTTIAVHRACVEAHLNLGQLYQDSGNFEEAERSYRNALRHRPNFAAALLGLGTVLNALRRPSEAETALRRAQAQPDAGVLAVPLACNLGIARQLAGDYAGALAHFEYAGRIDTTNSKICHEKGRLLHHLGRTEEALSSFRRAVGCDPTNLSAHYDLNQLLYRLRSEDFLASFDQAAVRRPTDVRLPLAKAQLLLKSDRAGEAHEIFATLYKVEPKNLGVIEGLAASEVELNKCGAAIDHYRAGLKGNPEDVTLMAGLSVALIRAREAKDAANTAEQILSRHPYDQTILAILGSAWRMTNDAREEELNRYDELVQVIDLEPPDGYTDAILFNQDLNRMLDPLHPEAREYLDQSLRGGTQTSGDIFSVGPELVQRLKARIAEAVELYISRLPSSDKHPFLSRSAGGFAYKGAWSSRLRCDGYHSSHAHPAGWISSAYYISLPSSVARGSDGQGSLQFGEPPFDLGFSDPVRRRIQPIVGRLVLFPSYLWHGTAPFHSREHRTTIAFDVIPRG
jgi:tetratricopeptide (TPR) repeat protein